VKGQISVEYLSLTSVLLLIVGVMFIFAIITVNENTRFNSAYYATKTLANAADEVSTKNGSTIVAKIELPPGVVSFSTLGNEVKIEMSSLFSTFEVFDSSKASLEPTSFSTAEGIHFIAVESTDSNVTFTEI
jgi:hypothetical protein